MHTSISEFISYFSVMFINYQSMYNYNKQASLYKKLLKNISFEYIWENLFLQQIHGPVYFELMNKKYFGSFIIGLFLDTYIYWDFYLS